MTKFAFIAPVILLLLTGCATKRIPFPEAELAGLNTQGDVSLTGSLFLVDQHEEKQVGSMQEVTLEPVSSYSDQWYQVAYLGNRSLETADPRYENYVRRTTTDKEGNFSFTDISPGRYYLSGIVGWRALNCSVNWVTTEIPVSNKIEVKQSPSHVTVELTKPFISPTQICDLYNQGDWEKDNPF